MEATPIPSPILAAGRATDEPSVSKISRAPKIRPPLRRSSARSEQEICCAA